MQSFKDFTKQLSQTHPQEAFSNFHLDISNIVATLKIDQEVTETGLEVEVSSSVEVIIMQSCDDLFLDQEKKVPFRFLLWLATHINSLP